MITFNYSNSSFSFKYAVFDCKVCGSAHISFEKDKYDLYIIPETITTKRKKNLEWYFCCVEECGELE